MVGSRQALVEQSFKVFLINTTQVLQAFPQCMNNYEFPFKALEIINARNNDPVALHVSDVALAKNITTLAEPKAHFFYLPEV